MVFKKWLTLINSKDIACLMVHAKVIESEKLKEKSVETKRAKTSNGNFSNEGSNGHGNPRFR